MIDGSELGFEEGLTTAYCHHCDYNPGLNTAKWRLWLHLWWNHPVHAWRLRRDE